MHKLLTPIFLFLAATLAGCSPLSGPDYRSLGLVDVSGHVLLDGQPLPGVTVEFHDEANAVFSFGHTDAAGRYEVMFDSNQPGIIPGPRILKFRDGPPAGYAEFAASASSPGNSDEESAVGDPDAAAPVVEARIPACYLNKLKTEVVIPNDDATIDIKLTKNCTPVAVVIE